MKKDGAKSLETEKNDKIIIPNCFSLPRRRHCEKKAERFFHKKGQTIRAATECVTNSDQQTISIRLDREKPSKCRL